MALKDEVGKAWDGVLSPLFEELSAEVLVQSVDPSSTQRDPVYGETAAKAFTAPVSVRARVRLERDQLVLPGGSSVEIDGTVTVRTDELNTKGVNLDIGSRITFQGRRYAVVHRESRAEVADRFLLVRAGIREEG